MRKTLREKINFWFEDIVTPMGRAVDIAVVGLVFVFSAIFVIRTYPIPETASRVLHAIEYIIAGIFVLEYVLRIWSSPQRIRQVFKLYSIIDLLAIIPVFFAQESFQLLRVFRALRFLRLIRFLRREHFFFRRLTPMHIIVLRIVYIICSIIFVSSGMIFYAEHNLPDTQIQTFFDAFYFSIVTLSTVGFGDVTPASSYGRFITILIILSGIVFIPWQIRDLIQQLFTHAWKMDLTCQSCGMKFHDHDARHCKGCGSGLPLK